jgi:predicted nucleotidyltransferase
MTTSQRAALARVFEQDARVAYGLLFGSVARGQARADSDVDVALGLVDGAQMDPLAVGRLVSDLERASGHTVDMVLLHGAPPALAYRIFRDGLVLMTRVRSALVERKSGRSSTTLTSNPLNRRL